jgi:hypothetical protein
MLDSYATGRELRPWTAVVTDAVQTSILQDKRESLQ